MSFRSLYRHGFARVAACTIDSRLADPAANAQAILDEARLCHEAGAVLAVFPELCLSGYAIDDLLLQDVLLDAVQAALVTLAEATQALRPILLVGAPLRLGHRLFNTAVVLHRGRILGVVPKTHLPNYREFYEKRHFASGAGLTGQTIRLGGADIPFGTDLLFAAEDLPGFALHVEICEDVWVPVPPSSHGALAGATVLANLSASNITIGKAETRRLLSAGAVGALPRRLSLRRRRGGGIDHRPRLGRPGLDLRERRDPGRDRPLPARPPSAPSPISTSTASGRSGCAWAPSTTTAAPSGLTPRASAHVPLRLDPPQADLGLRRPLERFPFVPADPARLDQDCYEAYNIQVAGLAQRLRGDRRARRVVIGVSGGLDSTHALIVAARASICSACRARTSWPSPCRASRPATRPRTNASRLMKALGVTGGEIDIRPAARQMLADMGHPFGRGEPVYDVTFENVQAGLRTDYLFRLANQHDAIVIGTGDLSELALGWCTYGVGDQMSHYNVNAGVPKTLIQHLIRWVISSGQFAAEVGADARRDPGHRDLAGTGAGRRRRDAAEHRGQDRPLRAAGFHPVPCAALRLPPVQDRLPGAACLGRCGARRLAAGIPRRPAASLRSARRSSTGWSVFLRRFFAFSQFKRSAMPNGPKVSAGGSALAARRLARAVGRQRRRLAPRVGDRGARYRFR